MPVDKENSHVHTPTCYLETNRADCSEYRIKLLEDLLHKALVDVRKLGGGVDKIDSYLNPLFKDRKV